MEMFAGGEYGWVKMMNSDSWEEEEETKEQEGKGTQWFEFWVDFF